VAWALSQITLPDWLAPLGDALSSDGATILVLSLVIGAYYAGARWLESRPWFPAWAIRVILGSAQTPTYTPIETDDGMGDVDPALFNENT
jgi:hypothetical protein